MFWFCEFCEKITKTNSLEGMESAATNHQNRNHEHDFENETRRSITTLIEGNSTSDFKAPMTNGIRKVPDLINVRPTNNSSMFNSFTNGPQQTIKPHFDRFSRGERDQFRNVPPLYSIKTAFTTYPERTNGTQKTLSSSSILANSSLAHNSRYNPQQLKSNLSNGYANGEDSIFYRNPHSSTTNFKRKNYKMSAALQAVRHLVQEMVGRWKPFSFDFLLFVKAATNGHRTGEISEFVVKNSSGLQFLQ